MSGPTAWPARSPDLTCLDLYLWGYMKLMVYETDIDSEEDLVARIVSAAAEVRETSVASLEGYDKVWHVDAPFVWMSMDVCSSTCCNVIKNWIQSDNSTLE